MFQRSCRRDLKKSKELKAMVSEAELVTNWRLKRPPFLLFIIYSVPHTLQSFCSPPPNISVNTQGILF
jgi:hypothetical protein